MIKKGTLREFPVWMVLDAWIESISAAAGEFYTLLILSFKESMKKIEFLLSPLNQCQQKNLDCWLEDNSIVQRQRFQPREGDTRISQFWLVTAEREYSFDFEWHAECANSWGQISWGIDSRKLRFPENCFLWISKYFSQKKKRTLD